MTGRRQRERKPSLVGMVALLLLVAFCCNAAAAERPRVTLVGKRPVLTVGRAWTAKLAVRPASFRGTVRVTASGPARMNVRASGGRGTYRARLVFRQPGRWTLTARAGAFTSRLGAVQVRAVAPQPLTFTEPTTIELEPSGTLLLVENSPGRVLRVDPATGITTTVASSLARPFGVARAASGSFFVSGGSLLRRFDPAGGPVTVAEADGDIGPVVVAPNGDVYYTTATRIFRLPAGAGPPVHVAGTGVEGGGGDGGPAVNAQFRAPHGLAVAADGALLISDTGNDKIRRIDPATGVITALAQVGTPDGIDIAGDGSIYVVDARERRVVRLNAAGGRIGFVGPSFQLPYDVEVADDGVTYVLQAGAAGRLFRVAADGTATAVSRP